jgi:DNA-binding response OmpR family regulator
MTHIILVDDDRDISQLTQTLLEMDGFSVAVFYDSERAKAGTTAETDACVIDCNLARGSNGLELLRAIRHGETPAPADCAVIMTSGDDRRRTEALEGGADCFLLKPYRLDDLLGAIYRLLAKEGQRE